MASAQDWLVVGYLAICLLFGGVLLDDRGIYLSHALLILSSTAFILLALIRAGIPGIWKWAAVAFIVAVLPIAADGNGSRLLEEQSKMLLLMFAAMGSSLFINWTIINLCSKVLPPLILLVCVVTSAFGLESDYGQGQELGLSRFGVPLWGSPNTTAFCLVIGLILTLSKIKRSGRWALFDVITLLGNLFFVGLAQSSGGMVMVTIVALCFLGLGRKYIISAILIAALTSIFFLLYLPHFELPELIGSGRLFIWRYLFSDLMQSGWNVILLGKGPGSVLINPWFTALVESAHNIYLELLYSYGLSGFALLLFLIIRYFGRLRLASHAPADNFFVEALFLVLLLGGVFDTYVLTAQLVWLSGFLVGALALIGHKSAAKGG